MAARGNGCQGAWLAESVCPILGKCDCVTDCPAHNQGILTTLSKTYRAEGATVMSVCIFGESALEFMRSSGRLAPEFLDRPRTQKLDGCGISPKVMFSDDMERLGVKTRPVHILVSKESGARSRDDIVCHRCAVWYEDIVEEHLYDQLVADVARAMGIRLRIRSGGFDARRNVLRMQLIPAFKRYAPALAR